MNDLQFRINKWQEATFPMATAYSTYAHFEDEVKELGESLGAPEEAADCAILLFGIAGKLGYDLLEEVEKKMVINKSRTWGKPDERGVVNHIEVGE